MNTPVTDRIRNWELKIHVAQPHLDRTVVCLRAIIMYLEEDAAERAPAQQSPVPLTAEDISKARGLLLPVIPLPPKENT